MASTYSCFVQNEKIRAKIIMAKKKDREEQQQEQLGCQEVK